MPAFRTLDALKSSLSAAGLGLLAGAVAATVRPVILFLRIQAPDDLLPPGASKMGGVPDLPEGFVWPERPPYPDAEKRAAEAMAFARKNVASREEQVYGPLEANKRLIPRAEIDRLIPAAAARGRAFRTSFPLGFVGQIDLAALSREPGFDADLPRTGLLSVFEDITGEGLAEARTLFWHDVAPEKLKRTPPPARLVEHFDLCGDYGLGADARWETLTLAETLVPFSAFTVPHHWTSAFPPGGAMAQKIWNWLQSGAEGEFAPSAPSFEGHKDPPQAGYFGDRLGGWPDPIQGDPEAEVGEPVVSPGKTRWRQIFAYAGEFYGGTRRMASDGKGDGTTYLMIDRGDLAALRFEATRWTYQMD